MTERHPNLLTAARRTVLAMRVKNTPITENEQVLINAGFMPATVKSAFDRGMKNE